MQNFAAQPVSGHDLLLRCGVKHTKNIVMSFHRGRIAAAIVTESRASDKLRATNWSLSLCRLEWSDTTPFLFPAALCACLHGNLKKSEEKTEGAETLNRLTPADP